VNPAVPAAVAGVPPPIALEANAQGWHTPKAADNPNAVYLGCTKEGWNLSADVKTTDQFCDESPDPESTTVDSRTISIEGSILGVFDEKILEQLYGFNKVSVNTDSFLHFLDPALVVAPEMSVLVLNRREVSAGVYKYGYILFPNCQQTASFPGGKFSSKERVVAPAKFVASGYAGYGGAAFTVWYEK
jgi:hypothetical protein